VLKPTEDIAWQPLPLDGRAEHALPEDLVVRGGEIGGSQRATIRRPLGRQDILLTDSRHWLQAPFM
jgi:hypothetical protein